MPLRGSTGMIKNSVRKRIPCFFTKVPTVPQWPHLIWFGAGCDPQEKKRMPIIRNEIIWILVAQTL